MNIKEIIKKCLDQDTQTAKYGNGKEVEFKRFIENGKEYTLAGVENINDRGAYLYIGNVGATVTRIKEGRPEHSLCINGECVEFAKLYANSVHSPEQFFKCKI